jgi:hypothetical protein
MVVMSLDPKEEAVRCTTFLILLPLALLTSCSDKKLPNGYSVRIADRGKTWIHDPDDHVVLSYVTAVGHDGQRIFTETRKLRDAPPYGYGDCLYFLTDTRTRVTVNLNEVGGQALESAKEQIRRAPTITGSRSCLS